MSVSTRSGKLAKEIQICAAFMKMSAKCDAYTRYCSKAIQPPPPYQRTSFMRQLKPRRSQAAQAIIKLLGHVYY